MKIEDLKWLGSDIRLLGTNHHKSNKERIKNHLQKYHNDVILVEAASTTKLVPSKSVEHKAIKEFQDKHGNLKWYPLHGCLDGYRFNKYKSKSEFGSDGDKSMKDLLNPDKREKVVKDNNITDENLEFVLKVLEEKEFKYFLQIAEKVNKGHSKILVIVGKAHVEGIKKFMNKEEYREIAHLLK